MKRCSKCKKIVWSWQQSQMALSSIHLKCHQESIKELMSDPDMAMIVIKETSAFRRATGIDSKLIT